MTLERHQALAEIESRLAGSERLRENYFRFGGLEACLAVPSRAPETAIPCDSRPFEAVEVVQPSPKPQNRQEEEWEEMRRDPHYAKLRYSMGFPLPPDIAS